MRIIVLMNWSVDHIVSFPSPLGFGHLPLLLLGNHIVRLGFFPVHILLGTYKNVKCQIFFSKIFKNKWYSICSLSWVIGTLLAYFGVRSVS